MKGRACLISAAIAASAFSFVAITANAPAAVNTRADAWEDALDALGPLITRAIAAEANSESAFDSTWRSHREKLRTLFLNARSAWANLQRGLKTLPGGSSKEDAFTSYLLTATTKYIGAENAYLRALRTGLVSDLNDGDRLARQGDSALFAARRIGNSIHPPSTRLERDLRQADDFIQANIGLKNRGEALYTRMISHLETRGIQDSGGEALKDAVAGELVYRQIAMNFARGPTCHGPPGRGSTATTDT